MNKNLDRFLKENGFSIDDLQDAMEERRASVSDLPIVSRAKKESFFHLYDETSQENDNKITFSDLELSITNLENVDIKSGTANLSSLKASNVNITSGSVSQDVTVPFFPTTNLGLPNKWYVDSTSEGFAKDLLQNHKTNYNSTYAGMVQAFATKNFTDFKDAAYGGTWMYCDGRLLANSSYPYLYQRIGRQFTGTNDSSTYFRIPDLTGKIENTTGTIVTTGTAVKGRAIACANSSIAAEGISRTTGTKTHTLTISEMPSHNHNNGEWDTILRYTKSNTTNGVDSANPAGTREPDIVYSNVMLPSGGNGAHNNMQPTIYLAYFIYCV